MALTKGYIRSTERSVTQAQTCVSSWAPKVIRFVVPMNRPSPHSWDNVSFHLIRELSSMGIPLSVMEYVRNRSASIGAGQGDVVVFMFRPVRTTREIAYQLCGNVKGTKICYSMAPESTRVSREEVDCYNSCFNAVFVPSSFCKATLLSSGVTRPIHIVRHGFDPSVFFNTHRNFDSKPLRLLYVGKGQAHKNPQAIHDAMGLLLDGEYRHDPIELVVKGPAGFNVEDSARRGLPTVKYIHEELDTARLGDIYRSCHIGILCSHGEGFGLTGLEALATGMPIVTAKFGGVMEYANDKNSFFADSIRIPSANTNGNVGEWVKVMPAKLAMLIGALSRNRLLIKEKASVARPSVDHLTWRNSASEFVRAVGAVSNVEAITN